MKHCVIWYILTDVSEELIVFITTRHNFDDGSSSETTINIYPTTERRGRVVNIPASYSGGPGSNLDPETGYPDWGFSWYSSIPPGKFPDSALN
jgi:hypothetical protein